jgi:hypothetical protein
MVRYFYILIFLFLGYGLVAQSGDPVVNEKRSIFPKMERMKWNMNIGSMYSNMPHFGSGMSYFAAPGFTYPLKNRISVHGGIISGFSSGILPVHGDYNHSSFNSGFTSVYGSVSYQLNEKVLFYGTGIKNLARYGGHSLLMNNSFDEINFGSSIQLSKSITIGASMHIRNYSVFPSNNPSFLLFDY